MILHTGIDGGLHDVIATNVFATLAWVALGANAAVYWGRQLVHRIRGDK